MSHDISQKLILLHHKLCRRPYLDVAASTCRTSSVQCCKRFSWLSLFVFLLTPFPSGRSKHHLKLPINWFCLPRRGGNLPTTWQQPNKTRPVTQAGQASSMSQRSGLMAGGRIIPALAAGRRRMFVLPSHIYDSKQNRKRWRQRLRVIYCSTFRSNH